MNTTFSETNLDLDKLQLEEVCTGGTHKHSWEKFDVGLHLETTDNGTLQP